VLSRRIETKSNLQTEDFMKRGGLDMPFGQHSGLLDHRQLLEI